MLIIRKMLDKNVNNIVAIMATDGCLLTERHVQLIDVNGTALESGSYGDSASDYAVKCKGASQFFGTENKWTCRNRIWTKLGDCKWYSILVLQTL